VSPHLVPVGSASTVSAEPSAQAPSLQSHTTLSKCIRIP
jgi:hypothetical protein